MNAIHFAQPCLATKLEFRNIEIKGKKQKRISNIISEAVKTWCGQEALCLLLLINLVTAYLASQQSGVQIIGSFLSGIIILSNDHYFLSSVTLSSPVCPGLRTPPSRSIWPSTSSSWSTFSSE